MQEFRKTQPATHDIESLKLIGPEHYVLENGTKVYTINAGSEDLLKIDLVFNAGSFFQSQPLLASLTNKCLQEGTKSYDAKTIAETVDFYGAYLRNGVNKDDARVSLFCLGKHFEDLLQLLKEVAFHPVFPEAETETITGTSKQEFIVNMEKVKYVARMRFPELILGSGHPYSSSVQAGDYDRIDAEILQQFHREFYAESPFYILVAGRIPENIYPLLNAHFGKHEVRENHVLQDVPPPDPISDNFRLIEKENALQSALRIGKILFNKHHPDFIGMQVVNTILGGYFGSRLMTNIREDKGYTYGIGSILTSMKHDGIFTIASEVGTDVRQKALDEVFMEIDKLRTEPVPEEELRLVKNYLLGNFLRHADGPFALSEMVKSVVDYDQTMDYFDKFLHTIKNITAKEINELAVKYLDPSTMVTLVVGK